MRHSSSCHAPRSASDAICDDAPRPGDADEREGFGRVIGDLVAWTATLTLAAVGGVFLTGRVDAGFVTHLTSPWVVQCAALLASTALLLALAGRTKRAILASGLALWAAALAWPVVVGSPGAPRNEEAAGVALRIVQANVCNRNEPTPEAIAWFQSEAADLVGVLELTDAWHEALRPLRATLPHVLIREQEARETGIALFSRFPLRDGAFRRSVPGGPLHIDAIVEHPSGPIRVIVAHPMSPRSIERSVYRDAELARIAESCASGDLPTIVIGDLNETPFGTPYQAFLATTGYRSVREAGGFTPSWPTELGGLPVPAILRVPIDHILLSPEFHPREVRVGTHIGSDHMPIVAEVAFVAPPRPALIASPLPSGRLEEP
jgi:endonuclease/exonuclease/phosphatase (EEP) superfamily protein YafD